jgi:tRNA pseudouridine38-40 synthase
MVYKLIIAYEGTAYHGWQVQPNGISVQAKVEEALAIILQEPIRITGSGRTDAGVHALGQVAHFKTQKTVDMNRILFALNSLLPKDIRVTSFEFLPQGFHAQHHAKSKIYRYHLYLDKVLNPFRRSFVWHKHAPFDQERLKQAIQQFLGTHDFTSFSNEAHKGVASRDPIRTIYRIDIIQEEGGIALEFEGDGFLYKMVRNIVGALVDCATGKRDPSDIPRIIQAKDRRLASMAAPPQGLFLVKVHY